MKLPFFPSLLAAVAFVCGFSTLPAQAQEPVSTGIVQEIVPATGVLTIRSDQTQKPVTFYGMNKANVFTVEGAPAQLIDLQVGTPVTVQYAIRGGQWYVSKVMFSARPASAAGGAGGGGGRPQMNINPSVSGGIPDQGNSAVRPVTTTNSTSPSGQ